MNNLFEMSWKFTRTEAADFMQPGFDDSGWENVNLPHDWAIRGPFAEENDADITIEDPFHGRTFKRYNPGRTGGLPHLGKGFYRRHFSLKESELEHVRVEFDGIMAHSRVYCNGIEAGGRPYGYSSFAVDLTPHVHAGDNVLAVSAENLPQASRWYPGAGIYRHVRLVTAPRIHIAHWGIRISTRGSQVNISVRIDNPDQQPVPLSIEIRDPDGRTTARSSQAAVRDFAFEIFLEEPRFWHPADPRLYSLTAVLGAEERTVSFGLRDVVYDPDRGLSVNGSPLKFQGVCLHHDLGPLGAAVNRDATRHRLRLLQTIGCNAIRTSHNPPDPELLDLCDEMGFMVICEAFDEWRRKKCPNGYNLDFDEWAEQDLRDMIRRDANHPSVFMWSIGNEIDEQYFPEEGPAMTRQLCDICHDEDPTRPVTAGLNNVDDSLTGGLFDGVDVKGFNYKPYIYSRYHSAFPKAPMYASESASTISSRGEYSPRICEELGRKDNLQVDSFDLCNSPGGNTPDHEFKGQEDNPFVMGEFVWTGFDYLGEPTPYNDIWPVRSAYYGIFDLTGIPKDRAYLYRSRWTGQDVLHLMPHWTWPGHEGQPLAVQCYTSFNTVELFVNGVSQGIRTRNVKKLYGHYRLIWNNVSYQPGELTARALDEDGRVLMGTTVRTAGEPHHLEASAERCGEMVFVTVSVVDRDGNLCPHASQRIDCRSSAEILAADAGDPTSTKPFHLPYVHAFHGQCSVFLKSAAPADLTLTARLGNQDAVLHQCNL